MNTFDSIHDIILAHDADYGIIKANQVLLEHLANLPPTFWAAPAKRLCPMHMASGRAVLIHIGAARICRRRRPLLWRLLRRLHF